MRSVQRPSSVEQEARLAPYETFIHEVETALAIVPPMGSGRVSRLNAIQHILFAGQPYQGDAGELLTHLQSVFPQQAAHAASLASQAPQMVASIPQAAKNPKITKTKSRIAPKGSSFFAKSFFNDDPFANDPFFQNTGTSLCSSSSLGSSDSSFGTTNNMTFSNAPNQFQAVPQSSSSMASNVQPLYGPSTSMENNQGPSRMAAIGQSLGSLAMMAGGLAAGYYLNKKSDGYPAQPMPYGYYNNPYGGAYPYGNAAPIASYYPSYGYSPPYAQMPYALGSGYGLNGLYNGALGGIPSNGYGVGVPVVSTPYQLPFGAYQGSMSQNNPYTYISPY